VYVALTCPVCGKPQEDYITVSQVAKLLHRDSRLVRKWCARGRFPGAHRNGPYKAWRIPASAVRPLIG